MAVNHFVASSHVNSFIAMANQLNHCKTVIDQVSISSTLIPQLTFVHIKYTQNALQKSILNKSLKE